MNNCDARITSGVLHREAARNKTAGDDEGRGGSIKKALRIYAHSAVKSGGFYTLQHRS